MWRSLLFVPILNARLVAGAAKRGADVIVLDLEAAVPPDRKAEARAALAAVLKDLHAASAEVAVRVNPLDQSGAKDIAASRTAGADLLVLPSATPETTHKAAEAAGHVPLIPLIEDPAGVLDARAIAAAAPSVVALGFGVEDYASAMGAPPTPALLEPAAVQVIQSARAEGKTPLVIPDTIADFRDTARFRAAIDRGRAFGAAGGFAIHPAQVDALNTAFSPTADEIAQARRVIAAAEAARQNGEAVAQLDGQMIDAPVEARARAVLRRATRPQI